MKQENAKGHGMNTMPPALQNPNVSVCKLLLHQYDYQWISFLLCVNRSCWFRRFHFHFATVLCLSVCESGYIYEFCLLKIKTLLYFRGDYPLWPSTTNTTRTIADTQQCIRLLDNFPCFSLSLFARSQQEINCIYWSGEPVILFMYLFITIGVKQ